MRIENKRIRRWGNAWDWGKLFGHERYMRDGLCLVHSGLIPPTTLFRSIIKHTLFLLKLHFPYFQSYFYHYPGYSSFLCQPQLTCRLSMTLPCSGPLNRGSPVAGWSQHKHPSLVCSPLIPFVPTPLLLPVYSCSTPTTTDPVCSHLSVWCSVHFL